MQKAERTQRLVLDIRHMGIGQDAWVMVEFVGPRDKVLDGGTLEAEVACIRGQGNMVPHQMKCMEELVQPWPEGKWKLCLDQDILAVGFAVETWD